MNDSGIQTESEFVFRRLAEPFRVIGLNTEVDGRFWLLILAAVLLVGLGFVVWMYIKDARAVRWYWAAPLGALRVTVYLLLALMFLMPARQAYERSEKRSRVLVVIDVTASMSQVSDEPPSARPSAKPATRLAKVMDYLSDDKIGFVRGLLDKNPVYLYRIGNRLDEDSQQFEKNDSGEYVPIHRVPGPVGAPQRATGSPWDNADWQAFAAYDFKTNQIGTDSITVTCTVPGGGTDSDGDGIPDAWEVANGLDPARKDAAEDPDKDGLTNGEEYLAGTDPKSAGSALRLLATLDASGPVKLLSTAVAGRTYTVQASDGVAPAGWINLVNIPARGTNRVVETEVLATGGRRFFRLVTPQVP